MGAEDETVLCFTWKLNQSRVSGQKEEVTLDRVIYVQLPAVEEPNVQHLGALLSQRGKWKSLWMLVWSPKKEETVFAAPC